VNIVSSKVEDDSDYQLFVHPMLSAEEEVVVHDKVKHLSIQQQDEVKQLLHKYSDVISDKPGCTDYVKHKIILKPNATVVNARPYKMSLEMQNKLKVEIESLLAEGLIEKSESEWASPVIVVPKPDKTIRAVIDFRAANKQFVGNSFPLPLIDDLISKIGQSKFLTKFDLSKGFYQIPLAEESKIYTAFCTPFGLYQWLRLPFGLKTSPAQFQSLMQKVLEGLDFCGVFIDDIVIGSETWEEHMVHVATVLDRLLKAKLTVKLVKSYFACSEIDYCGHKVGNGQISPREIKVKALLNMPRPENKKQLQSFLGSVNYYQRYIPKFAELVYPLTNLLRKKVAFVWNDFTENSYQTLKTLLAKEPILRIADYNKPFYIFTDASNVAVSSVLTQCDDQGLYHPISFLSHKLNLAQSRYSTIEKEALAIVLAVRSFRSYISCGTIIYTDHEPLSFINKMSTTNNRILRWSLELEPYELVVKHIKGTNNCFADFLSRPSA
jgi:hypothetical protein